MHISTSRSATWNAPNSQTRRGGGGDCRLVRLASWFAYVSAPRTRGDERKIPRLTKIPANARATRYVNAKSAGNSMVVLWEDG